MLAEDTRCLLLESKSKSVYDKWYKRYCEYKVEMDIVEDDINSILKFVNFLKDKYKFSSIWQAVSCINKKLMIERNFKFIKKIHFKSFMKNL